jgi:predicted metal-dependent peptidase
MLAAFFTELEKLAKFAEFTVIPFDTKVDDKKAFVWKKGSRRKWERVLSGGTSFEPVREWVDNPRARGKEWQNKTYDGVLVLTDMEAPKPKAQRTCQRAWVTTEYFARRPYFKPDKRDRLVAIDD